MTTPVELPNDVRHLLANKVDSLEKVEVMFLAWREPGTVWSVATASARLRLPADSVATALSELTDARLLAADSVGYRYAPGTAADAAAVVALCNLYDGDRLLVLREMSALAMERIRSSAARAFSDAFRFRRRDPGKGGSDA
jgi:hypothetical protein